MFNYCLYLFSQPGQQDSDNGTYYSVIASILKSGRKLVCFTTFDSGRDKKYRSYPEICTLKKACCG
jgi:hypothetical protein